MSSTVVYEIQPQDFSVDKKCRICGFADTKNVNIFSSSSSCKQLVMKILTVYPIVLYEDDPLPKNICKKCISNVGIMYNDVLRVMKTQIKWINNVRTVQPHHNYIRVLDLIQNTNKVTRDSIKAALDENVNELSVSRLLFTPNMGASSSSSISPSKGGKLKESVGKEKSSTKRHTSLSSLIDVEDDVARKKPPPATSSTGSVTAGSSEMRNIKSLLEQNGCSLVQVATQKNNNKSDSFVAPAAMKIKAENSDDESEQDKILLSILSKPSTNPTTVSVTTAESPPGPPPPLTVKCRHCPLQFNSLSLLATHQVIHMRLCVPKIFQKKYLHKRVRRGRLISVQDRKCIRCLNCWRIFVDNKSILDHWSMGDCDFFCHICGKEFAQSPKMLREHVPAAHGISYRSSKGHRERLPKKIMTSISKTMADDNNDYKLYQSVSEQEPLPFEELGGNSELTKSKTDQKKISTAVDGWVDVTKPTTSGGSSAEALKKSSDTKQSKDACVLCQICSQPFQNVKARNSHMRKHKPVYAYGDVVLPAQKVVDPHAKKDEDTNKPLDSSVKDVKIQTQPNNQNAAGTTPSTTQPKTSTLPLRGVRTKFVTPRSELGLRASGGGGGSVLKVKPLNELQKPAYGETQAWPSSTAPAPSALPVTDNVVPAQHIKSEQMHADIPLQQNAFTCISCSEPFCSKLELFRHKRKCRSNYLYNCERCSESFRCSADYQLHIEQNHRNSNNI